MYSKYCTRWTDHLSPLDDHRSSRQDLHGLAHATCWEPYDLHDLTRVGSALYTYRSCTTFDNDSYRIFCTLTVWSIWFVWSECSTRSIWSISSSISIRDVKVSVWCINYNPSLPPNDMSTSSFFSLERNDTWYLLQMLWLCFTTATHPSIQSRTNPCSTVMPRCYYGTSDTNTVMTWADGAGR